MIAYKRKVESETEIACDENCVYFTEAALNSSGCLTVRKVYDCGAENTYNAADELIVLTRKETNAIFNLFRLFRERDLPF